MSVSDQLKKVMKREGHRPADGARLAKVPYSTFYEIWKGRAPKPSGETLQKIAVAYGVTVEWLHSDAEPPPSVRPVPSGSAIKEQSPSYGTSSVRPVPSGSAIKEQSPSYGTSAAEPFFDFDLVLAYVAAIVDEDEDRMRLRRLDAVNHYRGWLTARGSLPGWWWTLREAVEGGKRSTSVSGAEALKLYAKAHDMLGQVRQERDGVPLATPRGERRPKPKLRTQGNRHA